MPFPPFDPLLYHYPSRRNAVYGRRGMVCTGNPLAAQAGLMALRKGGNAVDAAVAAAAALTVAEPTANGLGSDAFAIVYTGGRLYGLNASGPAPMAASLQTLLDAGADKVPETGVRSSVVPGAVSAWAALNDRFGKLDLLECLDDAVCYAEEGFPLEPAVGAGWKASFDRFSRLKAEYPELESWFDTFAPGGKCLGPGDILRLPGHAKTLKAIGASGGEAFYRGGIAREIGAYYRKMGGFLREEDLNAYHPEWVEPLTAGYHGYTVCELPPNGHGIAVLMALNILEGLEPDHDPFRSLHRQIEAMKLAFVDAQKYVADPRFMREVTPQMLLSAEYAASRRALVGPEALDPGPWTPVKGGTVYLCTADGEGNMVSYIQSNYMGFGSGVVVPGTGIAMNNRAANFSIDPASPNAFGPGKKPYHTIIPGFLMKDGQPVGPFGIMGGFMQPQAHLQLMLSTIDGHLNPQDALDKPRWMWTGGKTVEVEQSFDPALLGQLARAGHQVVIRPSAGPFGRGEAIWRDAETGLLCGGCEMRTDGQAAVW